MRPMHVVMLAAVVVAGCAHDPDGHVVRTGQVRFDANSVTGPKNALFTLESDGNWANGASRYERVGDQLRPVGGLGALFRPYGYVQIARLPNGIRYTPSWSSGVTWTFITEEGTQFPTDLEIPLYFAARLGLGGQWTNLWTPARDDRGPQLYTDCGLVLFEMEGRQVAGWLARGDANCPTPVYPGRETLARLNYSRNEVWESPERPLP